MLDLKEEIAIKITKKYVITKQRISDLLCCSFEGGYVGSTCLIIDKYIYPKGKTKNDYEGNPRYLQVQLEEGGEIILSENEVGTQYKDKHLNLDTIEKGLHLFAENYPKDFDDFIKENEDASTGDIFLQLCLFGEVIFC